MKNSLKCIHVLRPVLTLTFTQGLSTLGSAMTSFALIIWSYTQTGRALDTELLSVCSYIPYILMSIFAGALSDTWNKKRIMLTCDVFAAGTSLCVLLLLKSGRLAIWHLYVINAINGLMNSVQRPAAAVRSMSTENFCLAFGRTLPVWCLGAVLGWIAIPYMNANLDPVMRMSIPVGMQGRVYACRNTLQFFTIPLGYFLDGYLVDNVFEPLMAAQESGSLLLRIFGEGKGSGASLLFAIIGLCGVCVVGLFALDREIWKLENE